MSDQEEHLAEGARQAGNTHFRDKKYQHAIDSYTQSLDHLESPAVLCNRALCHSKLEEYGACTGKGWTCVHLCSSMQVPWS